MNDFTFEENSYIASSIGYEGYFAFVGEKKSDQANDLEYAIIEDVLSQKCVITDKYREDSNVKEYFRNQGLNMCEASIYSEMLILCPESSFA